MIRTQAGTYEVIEENRDGWNPEAFKERYSDILDKYDYIVGDWGYGQLRLRGFYDNSNRKVPFEQRIAALDEYLHEFCNFGCPYFVLRKVKSAQPVPDESPGAEESYAEINLVEPKKGDVQHAERRRRPRHNRPGRPEHTERQGGQQGERQARHERGEKPKFNRSEQKNGRDGGKERRNQQLRSNRGKEKIPVGPSSEGKRE